MPEDRTDAEGAVVMEDTALHAVARDLARAQDVPVVLRRIADLALAGAGADVCYLERVDFACQEVEVLATAGAAAPSVGARVPYPGSLAEEVIERDEPEIVAPEEMAKRPIAGLLSEPCLSCTALVVPLISERRAVGAVILLRHHGRPAFAPEEVARARVVSDMAALALQRVLSEEAAERRLRALEESERRFRLLVQNVRDYAIFMLDPQGRIVSWNEGAQRLKGYTADEAVGRHFSVFYTVEDRARAHPEHELAIATETGSYQEEGWRVRKDGSRFWAGVVITAIRDRRGELLGFAKVTRDLSERRRVEQALREERERYRALYEDNPAIFMTTDAGGVIVSINRFGAEYLGYTADQLLGTPVLDLVHEDDRGQFQEHVAWCLAHPGEFRAVEFRKVRNDGTVLWVREASRSVREPSGEMVLLNACEDITERVRAEAALREREALFRQISENIREVLWVSDPEFTRLYYLSPSYETVWGRTVRSALDDPHGFLESVLPEDRARVAAALPGMARGFDLEYRILRPDGETRWIHARAYPVPDARGNVLRAVGVAEDVTDRKRLLEAERAAREQVTSILERITDAFFALDTEWRFVYMNRGTRDAIRALLQKDPEEAMGRSFWGVVPQLVGTRFEEEYRRAMETQTAVHFEEFAPAFGVWFEVHAYPAPGGLSVYFRDVTERRRIEEERAQLLRREREARREAERRAREEEALRRAAEAVSAAFRVEEVVQLIAASALEATEADGAFVERVTADLRQVEIVAHAGERVPPIGSRTPFPGSLAEQVLREQQPYLIGQMREAERPLQDGLADACEGCSGVAVPLLDADEAIGALFLLRAPDRPPFRPDELARANTFATLASLAFRKVHLLEDSEQRREELERVMESRANLMRGFSHDVKNPLGAADGHLQLLEDEILGEIEPRQRESIARARRSIRAALGLINDLVELARAEAGQIEIREEPVDVRLAVREMVEEYTPQAEQEGLRMEVALPADLPLLDSDASRVRQVLGNLLSNAVKYTPEGGHVSVRVERRAGRGDDDPDPWITVTVRDTGPGIPEDKREAIFHEFTRLDPSAAHGAGLGLAISRRLARALGGDITVESQPGRGSTFTLWLPLTTAA